jgi:hypothetical protein
MLRSSKAVWLICREEFDARSVSEEDLSEGPVPVFEHFVTSKNVEDP